MEGRGSRDGEEQRHASLEEVGLGLGLKGRTGSALGKGREMAGGAGPGEMAGQADPRGPSRSWPCSPGSWTRPTTRPGSCSGRWTSRRSRARTCKCSWSICSPGGRAGGGAGGRAACGEDPGRSRKQGRERLPGKLGAPILEPPSRLEGKAAKEEIRDPWGQNPVPSRQEGPGPGNQGRGVQEVRPAGSPGIISCLPLAGRWVGGW